MIDDDEWPEADPSPVKTIQATRADGTGLHPTPQGGNGPAPWFDPASPALSGGEPTRTFSSASAAPANFACRTKPAFTARHPRAATAWPAAAPFLSVEFRYAGAAEAQSFIRHLGLSFSNSGIALLSPLAAVILAIGPDRRAIPLRETVPRGRQAPAIFGVRYEYAVIHGE